MKTLSLIVENKEFKIGLDDKYAQEIIDNIFKSLNQGTNNSITSLIGLVLKETHKNIELNAKITKILAKMS